MQTKIYERREEEDVEEEDVEESSGTVEDG